MFESRKDLSLLLVYIIYVIYLYYEVNKYKDIYEKSTNSYRLYQL